MKYWTEDRKAIMIILGIAGGLFIMANISWHMSQVLK